jgi:4'-phosphopantetheinyl transferase
MHKILAQGGAELKHNEVHLWSLSILPGQYDLDASFAILSADEQAKALRYKFDKDRYRSIICRAFLRLLLGRYLPLDPKTLLIHHSSYGKPYHRSVESGETISFNVSHSAELAIFGFSLSQRIGIDIEYTEKKINALEIAQQFFSEDEVLSLNNTPKRYQLIEFYKYWSLKEAYLKGIGIGLSDSMNEFSIQASDEDSTFRIEQTMIKPEANNWTLWSWLPSPGYIAAVAAEGEGGTLTIMP